MKIRLKEPRLLTLFLSCHFSTRRLTRLPLSTRTSPPLPFTSSIWLPLTFRMLFSAPNLLLFSQNCRPCLRAPKLMRRYCARRLEFLRSCLLFKIHRHGTTPPWARRHDAVLWDCLLSQLILDPRFASARMRLSPTFCLTHLPALV